MFSEARICLSSTAVGSIRVDSAEVRGEGGLIAPRLVVPVSIAFDPQPRERQLALVRLGARLTVQPQGSAQVLVIDAPNLDLTMNVRSQPAGHVSDHLELRFDLTPPTVSALDNARHSQDGELSLQLALEGTVAWLRWTGNDYDMERREVIGDDRIPRDFGSYSELLPFWSSAIDKLPFRIERSVWVDRIMPQLGLNTIRLIEIEFPNSSDQDRPALLFDEARRKLDLGNYSDCIAACRGVKNLIGRSLGAGKDNPVATILAQRLGWQDQDTRAALLGALWKGLNDLMNEASHPEGDRPSYSMADARACLMLTSVLLEYVSSLRKDARM